MPFLLSRLHILARLIPIEHFGYMLPRQPSSLRVCSKALSVKKACSAFPVLMKSTRLNEFMQSVSLNYKVKLSIDVASSYGDKMGIEFHPINRNHNTWRLFFQELDLMMAQSNVIFNNMKRFMDTSYYLSGRNSDYITMLALSHVKLSVKNGTILDVKTYVKACDMKFN
jgi:hypothetical protein